MTINGENIAPKGAGTGAAYVLGKTGPDALSILINGQRSREYAARQAAALQAKAQAEQAKQYLDDSKYNQDGSVYFGQALNDQVYQPLTGQLNEVYAKPGLDALGRAQLTRPLLQNTNNETVQSKAKTEYIKSTLDGFRNNPLYDAKYATEHLTKNLPAGTLPSKFDEEGWKASLLGDEKVYNEGEVVSRASKNLLDDVTIRVSQAGTLGGKHVMDQTRGQLMAFDANGSPVMNADGKHKVALTKEVDTMLDSDPLFKLKTDARVAAYDAERQKSVEAHAADPSVAELPAMSRRGVHAQMIEPLLHYDQTHDETLNAQVRQPRATSAGKPKANDVVPDSGAFGDYTLPAKTDVGRDYSTAKPLYPGGLPIPTDRRYAASQETLGGGGKPMRNNGKEVATVGSQIIGIERHDENGHWVRDGDNNKPFAGTYGNWFIDVRDKATGFRVTDKTKVQKAQLLRENKGEVATYINGYSIGKKDYTAAHDETLKKLKAANPATGMAGHKADPVLEDEARRIATTGSEPVVFPYNEQNARVVDPETQNFYRGALTKRQQIANEMRQPLHQAPAVAAPKATANLYPATKTAKTTPTTKAAPPKAEKVKGWY